MKKILVASTILATLGTVASAEVKLSGYGRFGLTYDSSRDDVDTNKTKTRIHTRLRLNIDAKTETDTGVVFGGRIRLQDSDNGTTNTAGALLYATYEGLRVEVGNTNTALDADASGLFYGSEMGLRDTSYGDSLSDFYSYSSGSVGSTYKGIFASYKLDGFSGAISYVNPDQTVEDLPDGVEAEKSLYLSYSIDAFTVAAGGSWDAAGVKDNDVWFIGGAYAFSDVATVGLNYISEGFVTATDGTTDDDTNTIVLYGNYTMDAITLRAYVSRNDHDGWKSNTAYGLGADYDLGGAKLTGSIQRGYSEETYADVGVRFDF